MGVPVDGLTVVGFSHMPDWSDFYADLLGHRLPGKDVGASNNIAVLCGLRQYAQFYILEMLGSMLFMDKSGERLSIMYLQFFNPIINGKNFSWGSAALSWLYRHLYNATKKIAKQISGALLLVQLWKEAKCTTKHPMHVLRAYRVSLASLQPNQIVWEPDESVLGSLLAYCTIGQHIWKSIVPLIHFWVVEGHHPKRVLRQFGMKQGVPVDVNTSTKLHKITLQGKQELKYMPRILLNGLHHPFMGR
ncbi:serine/threonine-protein phosphatase 7 long form homolog [Castanea sativa]|uniref:serine/threonine-protein phosphatase 7 long form homolog n=1 Tax=Castanea sativa TaxID=21020 RepID=UPI003F64D329